MGPGRRSPYFTDSGRQIGLDLDSLTVGDAREQLLVSRSLDTLFCNSNTVVIVVQCCTANIMSKQAIRKAIRSRLKDVSDDHILSQCK